MTVQTLMRGLALGAALLGAGSCAGSRAAPAATKQADGQAVAVYPQTGHTYPILSIDYSPDGARILSAALDGTAKIWEVDSRREVFTLKGHNGALHAAVFSPDGTLAASASADKTVKIWDARTGRELRTLAGHGGAVRDCAFSPDGALLASCSGDGGIRVWDLARGGKEVLVLKGHEDAVLEIAYSPDGNSFASCSADKTLRLWDSGSGGERWVARAAGSFRSVSFSPDGKRIAASEGNIVRIVDADDGNTLLELSGHGGAVYAASFSADGTHIVTASGDRTVKVWDAQSGAPVHSKGGFSGDVICARFNPDGAYIAAVDAALFLIYVWDWRAEVDEARIAGYAAAVHRIAYSPDGQSVASAAADGRVRIWDVHSGRERREFAGAHGHSVNAVFSPDGALLAAASFDGKVRIWDAASGDLLKTLDAGAGQLFNIAFSPDGTRVAAGSGWWSAFGFGPPVGTAVHNAVHVWDAHSGEKTLTLAGHRGRVSAVCFSPDGERIVSSSQDRSVKIWDARSGQELHSAEDITNNKIALSPDGKEIACADDDGTIAVIDAADGKKLRAFPSKGGADIEKIVYDRAGAHIAIAADDNTLRMLDAQSGAQTQLVHTGVTALALDYSPDDARLAAGFLDGSTRFYDARTGEEIVQCIGFTPGEWATLTPNGYYNASPKGDEYINVRAGGRVDGIAQYRGLYYQPNLVEARVRGDNRAYNAAGIHDAATFLPPEVALQTPASGAVLTTRNAELAFTVRDDKRPIQTIAVIVNGRKLGRSELQFARSSPQLIAVNDAEIIPPSGAQNIALNLPIQLEEGENRIEVLAANAYSQGRAKTIVRLESRAAQEASRLPALWTLTIGVNHYEEAAISNLRYAVQDARAIAAAFGAQAGKLYTPVYNILVADDAPLKPTKETILAAFERLKRADARDTIVIFISGHGVSDKDGNYHLLPSEIRIREDGAVPLEDAVPNTAINTVLNQPGKKLIFIDSCHSGGISGPNVRTVDNNRLIKELQDFSTVIFASSKTDEYAIESPIYHHGLFTHSIIRGMAGEAESKVIRGKVTMMGLASYVSESVAALSGNRQHPVMYTPDGYDYFNIAALP